MKKPRARKSCKLQQLHRERVEEAFNLGWRSDTCMVGKWHVVGRGVLQKEQVSLQKNKCRFCQASERKRQERKRENFVLFWFRPQRVGRPNWPLRWLRGSMASWEGEAQHLIKVKTYAFSFYCLTEGEPTQQGWSLSQGVDLAYLEC